MSRVRSAALLGVDGVPVEVEVRISSQLPRVDVVGLASAAVRESTARVRSAIQASGHRFPEQRVTVNLAPAELRKTGAGLDLPIAVAILAQSGVVPVEALTELALVGELALDGRLRPVRGALALALAAQRAGSRRLIVARANGPEAALAPELATFVAPDLASVIGHLLDAEPLDEAVAGEPAPPSRVACLADVRGQEGAKQALEVAAAGGHALLLRGAPGSGKTMLARRLPGLLPALRFEESLEVTRIHGAAGGTGGAGGAPVSERPFRAPHHTASTAGLLGGRNPPQPGEVSLAHGGVLFLDELPEFERRALESLRQVLEQRSVVVARAGSRCVFPADFQLVAATNPCPCGWLGSGRRECLCDDGAVARYAARMSGPLLDRIDLHVDVAPLRWAELDAGPRGEPSDPVRKRVEAARALQMLRAGCLNARLPDRRLDAVVSATAEARRLLGRAVDRFGLSARAARRALKVARTGADLAGESDVGPAAMARALAHRSETQGA
ncbi:MAG: YifB family Mg chelatase-like AAA ATPase [Myxococcota bacterium]